MDDLVAHALADNPDLQATQAEVDAAHRRLQQAGLRPNPILDLSVQKNVAGPDNNLTASVTLPLDLNGLRAGRIGVAAGELEMKRAQAAERARRLRAEVRMKAGELLAAQRNLRFTEPPATGAPASPAEVVLSPEAMSRAGIKTAQAEGVAPRPPFSSLERCWPTCTVRYASAPLSGALSPGSTSS